MRQPVIKLSEMPAELIKHARQQVAAAMMAGHPMVVMFGQYCIGPESEPPKDPTQSERIIATCTECGRPIWSTVLKETILAVAQPLVEARICCTDLKDGGGCLVKAVNLLTAEVTRMDRGKDDPTVTPPDERDNNPTIDKGTSEFVV